MGNVNPGETGSSAFDGLSPTAAQLHQALMSQDSSKLYTQTELKAIAGISDDKALLACTQELMNHHLMTLAQENNTLLFKPASTSDALRKKNMTPDEAMVYSYIEAAGREGIWTKTIKQKSNLHNVVVNKCIKSLESQNYIKQVKSVKYSTRKIYMLASLQPSTEVTGGPWFTDKELDSEFVNGLLEVIWRYVVSLAYVNANQISAKSISDIANMDPILSAQKRDGYPTVDQIHKFVEESNVCNISLTVSNIRALCEVLVYDDKLERINGGYAYKATWSSVIRAKSFSNTSDVSDFVIELPTTTANNCIYYGDPLIF